MNNRRIGLILLLLLLTVGFATVTTNLIINNTSNISSKPDDFSVIFKSANTEEESTATISDDKKSITYVTKELVNPGDKSELEYTIKNNSSQYDADINLSIGLDNSISDLLSITYETIDNINTVNLPAKEDITGKIKIELIKPAINNMEVALTVTFDATATERSSIAYDNYTIRFNPNGGTGSMDDQVMEYDMNTSLLSNQFTRSGYQMIGWTTNPETNEDFYQDEQEVSKLTTGGTTIDLYAVWLKTDYTYTGGEQQLTVPATATYKIELWGAQGYRSTGGAAGMGGYTSGNINLTKGTNLYFYVGNQGTATVSAWNGGGYCHKNNGVNCGTSGGGGVDVRVVNGAWNNADSLRSRIMVAGSGGGAGGYNGGATYYSTPGYGGGLTAGNSGSYDVYSGSTGANQTTAGHGVSSDTARISDTYGSFGMASQTDNNNCCGAGGGSGWYGGGGGCGTSAGGGSAYISGHLGSVAVTSMTSSTPKSGCTTGNAIEACSLSPYGYKFSDTVMIDGAGYKWTNTRGAREQMPNPSGGYYASGKGHEGAGYARITFVSVS